MRLPIVTLPLPDELRRALRAGPNLPRREVIVGMRPEHFEDAALVSPQRHGGATFRANVDVLESVGSEYYAYLKVESERVSARELEELAEEAGSADLPGAGSRRVQLVARLSDGTKARKGQPLELWYDPQHLQLFDPATGRSLFAGGQHQSANAAIAAAA